MEERAASKGDKRKRLCPAPDTIDKGIQKDKRRGDASEKENFLIVISSFQHCDVDNLWIIKTDEYLARLRVSDQTIRKTSHPTIIRKVLSRRETNF
jgi:hypothetical protein